MNLEALNRAPAPAATAEFLRCCGSQAWAARMAAGRPYASAAELEDAADRAWRECGREDWLEAFAAHPRIGARANHAWSSQEQSAAAGAAGEMQAALAEANQRYEAKFGYIYIVCATGKTAAEMLELLRRRLENDPAGEIHEAAGQQREITRLRLRKLLSE